LVLCASPATSDGSTRLRWGWNIRAGGLLRPGLSVSLERSSSDVVMRPEASEDF
jgi:hypothetical protein